MKFEALLESLEQREFRGQYFRFKELKRRLKIVANKDNKGLAVLARKPSRCLSPTSEDTVGEQFSGRDEDAARWRTQVETEAERIGDRVSMGLRELQSQLDVLYGFVQEGGAIDAMIEPIDGAGDASPGGMSQSGFFRRTSVQMLEMRSLDALGQLAEGMSRWREFAELNYASLIRIWQKYDEYLGTTEGVNSHLPRIVEKTGVGNMERFDALDLDIKAAVMTVPSLQGLQATPQVARLIAGLGAERNPASIRFGWQLFALGLSIGFCVALLVMTLTLVALPAKQPSTFNMVYFLAPLGVFRLTLIVPLVYWSVGITTWICDRKCINYFFILGIDPRCQLTPGFFFKKAALLQSLWLLIFTGYVLDYKWMIMPAQSAESTSIPRASSHYLHFSIATLLVTFVGEVGPSRICRYRYRFGIIGALGRVMAAPFFAVTFADNLVGDVLTSLSRPMMDVPVAYCYLASKHPQTEGQLRHFVKYRSHCPDWENFYIRPLIAGAPLFFRAMQCLRRYKDLRDPTHLLNFFKYVSSLCVVILPRMFNDKYIIIAISVWASIYSAWWDVVKDWGLGPCELYSIYMANRLQRSLQMFPGASPPNSASASPPATTFSNAFRSPHTTAARDALGRDLQLVFSNTSSMVGGAWTRHSTPNGPFSSRLNGSHEATTARGGHSNHRYHGHLRNAAQKRQFSASFYGMAVLFDIAGRLTWALNFLPLYVVSKDLTNQSALLFFIIVVEISRRALWVVLRLEWEQVSNASGYRALLWVPAKIKHAYRDRQPSKSGSSKMPRSARADDQLLQPLDVNGVDIELYERA